MVGLAASSSARFFPALVLLDEEVAGGAGKGTPDASRSSTSMPTMRRGMAVSLSVSGCGGVKAVEGEMEEVLAATKPARAILEEGSAAWRALNISVARVLTSGDDEGEEEEVRRERPAAWSNETGGLDL